MLQLKNIKLSKLKIPLLLIPISFGGIFLFQYLTFIPEYSRATTVIETPVYDEKHPNLSDISTMQAMTTEICDNTPEHYSKPLTDTRDGQSYQVTKLKGITGCWMTQNIDYDGGLRMTHHDDYGGYYNSSNAIAVCDLVGWQLPTKEQYDILLNSYNVSNNLAGSTILRNAPLSFLYGGYSNGSSPLNTGNSGYYRSSTPQSISMYSLYFDNTTAGLNGSLNIVRGYSVRCVASGTITPEVITPNPDVSVTVPNILTLSINDKSIDIDTSKDNPVEGTFTATVTANNQYKIALNTTEGSNINLVNTTNPSHYIPALSTDNSVTISSDKWWGIKCNPENNTTKQTCNKPDYTGLTLTLDTYFTSTSGTPSTGISTPFTIGIKISPDLPSGTYSSSITVTASSPN